MSGDHAVVTIARAGVGVVAAYAAWAVLQILILNPLATVPDVGLGDIYASVWTAGDVLAVAWAIVVPFAGVVLAVLLSVMLTRSRATTPRVAVITYLGVLVTGAPAYFIASFPMGLSVADAFLTSGGDHSGGSWPLYIASAAALVALVVVAATAPRHQPSKV